MKMNLATRQDQQHVPWLVALIVKPEAHHRCLTILVIQGLKREIIHPHHVGLGIVRYSLLIRHFFLVDRVKQTFQISDGAAGAIGTSALLIRGQDTTIQSEFTCFW